MITMSTKRTKQTTLLQFGFKIKEKSQSSNQKNCDNKVIKIKLTNNNNNSTLTQIYSDKLSTLLNSS